MAAREPVFVAVDAGTTGARACAVAADGTLVCEIRHAYPTATPRPGWAEQDPGDWRDAALAGLTDLVATVGGERIAAIGLTGQCPTIAPIDGRGQPVGPGMLYRDNRATAEAQAMRDRFGIAAAHARTGHVPEAFHVTPKILWLRAHAPDVFAAADRFLQPRDVVLAALTGTVATDETHANATVLFDLRARDWADDLLDAVQLERTAFPPVAPPWTVIGGLAPDAARTTGAPAGTPVVLGAADSQCAAYGSGLLAPGPVSEMAGASSCLNSVVLEPLSDVRVTHYSDVSPGRYSTELGLNTSGAATSWAVAELGFGGYDDLEASALRVRRRHREHPPADPLDLAPIFLPHLGDGERDDPRLRAAFVGLSDRHGRDELAYAVLEGIAFGVAETVGVLVAAGAPCDELRVAGGGARLGLLGALKADVLGVPVRHMAVDSAPVGVAMLAAAATGHGTVAREGIAAGLARATVIEPAGTGRTALAERLAWFRAVRAAAAVRVPDTAPGPRPERAGGSTA